MIKEEFGSIIFEQDEIHYIREFKNVKNLNLHVKNDGTVYVSANKKISDRQVKEFLYKHGKWILQSRKKLICKERQNNINFIDGEKIYLLGHCYKLNILKGDQNFIRLNGDEFFYQVKSNDLKRMESYFHKWRKEFAFSIYREVVKKYILYFESKTVFPSIVVKNVKTRWGSCTPSKNKIMLAEKLIEKRMEAIEYVVVHELCHFYYMNHSKAFYQTVERVLSDWKIRKRLLYI